MFLSHGDNLPWFCLLLALCVLGLAVLGMRTDGHLFRRHLAADEQARRQWSRNLFDASFDGLLIHRQGLILQMNHALVRMLGVRERECLGQVFAGMARPDQVAALRTELEAPHPQIAEFYLLRANKTEMPVEICSHNTEFEGQPVTVTAVRDISLRMSDAARIARMTHYDALTGLANRRHFGEALALSLVQTGRGGGTVTVFTIDLLRFKPMNELLGRAGGDALLKSVAARLGNMTPKGDMLARLGGDKFALLLHSPQGANRAQSFGGQMIAAFNEPFIIEGQLVTLSLSVGMAVYPDHAADAEALAKASEFALAQAEAAGGGTAHLFCHTEAGFSRRAATRGSAKSAPQEPPGLAAELRAAYQRGEVTLAYQPFFRAGDLAPAGFEAQPHWQHPSEGLIGPERWPALQAQAGLGPELASHLLERACAAAQQAGGVRLAMNIEAAQLWDVGLPGRIGAILRQTGLAPAKLELEVTEALLLENRAGAAQALQRLQAVGVGITLDDFGAANFSLSALCDLPISRLKIDRRFIQKLGQDANADAIVSAILALAANLRLEVTANGVESEAQLAFLRRNFCHCVQGSLLGVAGPHPLAAPVVLARTPVLVASRAG